MHIFEAKSKAQWQRILEQFSQETGMPAAVFDTDNNLLLTTADRHKICFDIRNNDDAPGTICGPSQALLALMAKNKKEPVTDFCEASFIKTIVPYFHDIEFLGGLTACGDADPDFMIELPYIAEALQVQEEDLVADDIHENQIDKIQEISQKYYKMLNEPKSEIK